MPVGFLTEAERERFNGFPQDIAYADLSAYFTLTEGDIQAINHQRSDYNRLGFALQLCALRYLGFVPDDLGTAPLSAVEFIAEQLGVAAAAIGAYGQPGFSSKELYP
jgi:TnpA family transposase